jgi:hypothetical protein
MLKGGTTQIGKEVPYDLILMDWQYEKSEAFLHTMNGKMLAYC